MNPDSQSVEVLPEAGGVLVSTLVVTLIGLGTLAFGAVYPWAYFPLLGAAALIGVVGLWRGRVLAQHRRRKGTKRLVCPACKQLGAGAFACPTCRKLVWIAGA